MVTIGEITSRLRNIIKAVKEDTFITDRFLYSMVFKFAKALIRRQDNERKIMKVRSLFSKIPCVELIEVDRIEACCAGIKSNCTIMRTKYKLPALVEGSAGPLIRGVSTLDDSIYFEGTTSKTYVSIANSSNFKHNKAKYYWYMGGHLYFPDIPYEGVNVEAMWEDDVSYLQCDEENKCKPRQDTIAPIPDYLIAEAETMVLQELGISMQLPSDVADDKQSILRT